MRVQSPIAGNMSGSTGGLVFQHYNGRTFARSKPVLFHYGPTPAQLAAQNKYYGTRSQWLPLYRNLKPYIPAAQLELANPFNNLTEGVYKAMGTFANANSIDIPRKFGFDIYDNLNLRLGAWTLYNQKPFYFVTFYDFEYSSRVDFVPEYAHALFFCPDLKQMQYAPVEWDAEHLTFYFDNSADWFPNHEVELYVALSDTQFFSNFFY